MTLKFLSMNTEVGVERKTLNQVPETHIKGMGLIRRSVDITEEERERERE